MQIRISIFFLLLVALSLPAHSQPNLITPGSTGYYNDALRFSRTTFGGSARYLGIAGAQTALGGDIGSIGGNPAGLGFFRRSEFSVSPAINFATSNSSYDAGSFGTGTDTPDSRGKFNFGNIGVVFANAKGGYGSGSSWRGGAFGIGYTRINSFTNRYSYDGSNTGSVVDYFDQLGKEYSPSELQEDYFPLDLNLAYETYLMDVDTSGTFFRRYPFPDRYADGSYRPEFVSPTNLRQTGTIETSGNQSQVDLAYGGNFGDKFYIGGAIGINSIRYNESRMYSEENIPGDGPASSFNSLSLTDELNTTGTGVNLRLGAIFRPADWIRLGGSVQTPTYYIVNEISSSTLTVNYNNFSYSQDNNGVETILRQVSASTEPNNFRYSLTTPFRATAGLAIFAGKYGFWSTDVEYVAYNDAKLKAADVSFIEDNQTINNLYKSGINVRSGAEYRNGIFRLRAGGGYYGDPYKNNADKLNRSTVFITGGAGIRMPDYYFDLAVVNSGSKNGFTPYTLTDGTHPEVSVKSRLTSVTFTFGTFF